MPSARALLSSLDNPVKVKYMDILACERELALLSYPDGCDWQLLCREIATDAHCALSWWSTTLRPHGGLYLVTRIAETGQLASALKTEATLVQSTDPHYFHYSKYPRYLHQIIGALWSRAWPVVVEAMHITSTSPILQEWITTLDTFEGADYFQKAHKQYLFVKRQEALAPKSVKTFKKNAQKTNTRHKGKKSLKYEPLNWETRWNQK